MKMAIFCLIDAIASLQMGGEEKEGEESEGVADDEEDFPVVLHSPGFL